jgi:hypothetical protein
MFKFHGRFTRGIASVLELLTSIIKGGKKTLEWTTAMDSAFQHSKQVLATPNTAIAMSTDSSNTHIGSTLHQQVRGSWQLLGFFSRKLKLAESKYSTFDWELLNAVTAIRHFRHILEGRDFKLWTDHRPLVSAVSTHTCFRTVVGQAAVPPGLHSRIYYGH